MKAFVSVDEYINAQEENVRAILEEIRLTIKKAAPNAEEVISYGMPAYKQDGVLVYFAACKNHIGFYPTGKGVAEFENILTDYKTSKGAIQFPLNKKMPLPLVAKIVKFRVKQNEVKAAEKKKKK
ncbi:MAG TPA: DUF1801 domain-containing protein [Bacteroidia bacterium]|jgi:uncharacterized protein YdhG (YjbR/CyaY superfamily)|nr:DUF1801 domain-containing protein [Bacteroidia bacterium]HQK98171.1 DUF1801 domain-containing protein [Bacteroidia bacterium]